MYKRITLLGAIMILSNAVLVANLAFYMKNSSYAETALHQSQITVTAGTSEGVIYDRNFKPFVNQESNYYAFVNPTQESISELLTHTKEITPVLKALQTKLPFSCQVDISDFESPDIIVLELPQRYSENPFAQHVLGYTLEHTGITGLESDYNEILRNFEDTASVTYTVDATGHVLAGAEKIISPVENKNSGIVTTLDINIQEICESQELEKGAIVVMDIQSGDILAMASFPDYT
ncbi:MAG: hypothetical protein K2J88_03440, partial [Oscillospiraceae bacterium]|nr:hypothetical protein [Oscillospiraceae bacterium]